MNWNEKYEDDPEDTLIEMYWGREYTLEQMGEIFGITRQAVHQRMEAHGVERGRNYAEPTEVEKLEVQRDFIASLLLSGRTQVEVAEKLDTSVLAIRTIARTIDGYDPTQSYASRQWDNEQVRTMRTNVSKGWISAYELAERQDVSPPTIYRMLKGKTYSDYGGPIKGVDYD